MDIGELLAYKPEQTPKRKSDDDPDTDETEPPTPERPSKLRKTSYDFPDTPTRDQNAAREESFRQPGQAEIEKLNIMRYVETEAADVDILNEAGLRKLVLIFEKRVLRNQEMRIKFPENPERFMETELELHEVLQQLHAIATVPDLYPLFVDLHAVPSLLELLAHSNTDISVTVCDLLQELTDVDILHESIEGAEVLIEALRKQQVCALLVQNLERMDETEKEESKGVHDTLGVFENLMEIKSEVCVEAANQGLMQWILKRLKAKLPFDANKLYCSEILSILIQESKENRLLLGTLDGIDVLLQQLAVYKRHDPATVEEREFMENLFNSMCSALMAAENREKFLKGEGLQLMNLMLREKKLSRNGSLKVLDYAMSGPDGKDNCNKFVEILGLRTIFPLFMKTPKRNKKRLLGTDEYEEHVCSIIASMLRNCKSGQRQRLLSKFTENDFEKVERLMEFHLKYLAKVEAIDEKLEENPDEVEDTDANYLTRLSGGLFTLQLVDYIILEICATNETVKQRVLKILNMRGQEMKIIRQVMREYAGNLGDAGDKEWRDQEEAHIIQLVDRF
ncbi:beta-catenin-like protein 1 [Phlebotomus argentipes]|uniref:beta-catenin-like protein 1 n=1 Tax=Phlebotomus argentipes TaxID=94469 RepID=UPI00289344AE|nr:beta-catenin-like protein 1 [Phlebotomus argentipes]